jgi:hypothetical protein
MRPDERLSSAQARYWLRQAIWVWPIVGALLLLLVSYFLRGTMDKAVRDDVRSGLESIVRAEVAALRLWYRAQEQIAQSLASDRQVIDSARSLLNLGPQASVSDLVGSPHQTQLRLELESHLKQHDFTGFLLVRPDLTIVASARPELLSVTLQASDREAWDRHVSRGKATISSPQPSRVLLLDQDQASRAGVPTMFAWAAVKDDVGEVIGGFAFRIDPQKQFQDLLNIGRYAHFAETYAFNRDGVMISESRFREELARIGLLSASERSSLNIPLRDPGVDLTRGSAVPANLDQRPLTLMAAAATSGQSGSDAAGYRDYRGVLVVGAWQWLEDYGIGVATEQNFQEAFLSFTYLRLFVWGLFCLLVALAGVIYAMLSFASRLDRQAQMAALQAKRLGQYALNEKIGEGGMGVVYRAHHAMLHRPTAVKFLHPQKSTLKSVHRFEQEVQLTSQLTHPNTVTVYDFGRTPEGIFYYAMELVDGVTLEDVVEKSGPLPEPRVIAILAQVAGSLAEAHEKGLVHRDIKPANIMLSIQGGIFDFVKVLDFGLACSVDVGRDARMTSDDAIAGTPLYLSPEAIQNSDRIDPRSDLYSLGAVGYFLMTGRPVFEGTSVAEILHQHINTMPKRPSLVVDRTLMPELESLIMKCLAKNPDDRPGSARELADDLADLSSHYPWSQLQARQAWLGKPRILAHWDAPANTELSTEVDNEFKGVTTVKLKDDQTGRS